MIEILFFAATLGTPLALALPLVRLSQLGGFSTPARAAIAWSCGTLLLSLLLTMAAALGIAWRPWPVMMAALVAAATTVWMPAPSGASGTRAVQPGRPVVIAVGLCLLVAAAGLVLFAVGAGTSADLSYVWGAKAVHFAIDRGMDFHWMEQPYLIHLHPNYPPLWPVTLAWGAMISGSMPWTTVPILTWVSLIATGLIVHSLLRPPLGNRNAMVVSCLWFAVLTGSALHSFSGGSAEGPLLLFVTIAVTVLVVESRESASTYRWLAACALAGAVLTKSEGTVAATLIVVGTGIRDGLWGRPGVIGNTSRLALPAVAVAGLWAAIRVVHGLPLTDPIREAALHIDFANVEVIVKTCARLLGSPVLLVGWLVPLLAASGAGPYRALRILPGLAVACGLPLFAAFYYLHAAGSPVEIIVWTFPRLVQPAISAWVVSLGVVCFATTEIPPGGRD